MHLPYARKSHAPNLAIVFVICSIHYLHTIPFAFVNCIVIPLLLEICLLACCGGLEGMCLLTSLSILSPILCLSLSLLFIHCTSLLWEVEKGAGGRGRWSGDSDGWMVVVEWGWPGAGRQTDRAAAAVVAGGWWEDL